MKTKTILIILAIGLIIAVVFFLGRCSKECLDSSLPSIPNDTSVTITPRAEIKHDTLPAIVKWRTKYVGVPEYVSIADTLFDTINHIDTVEFKAKPFTASHCDTLKTRDTLCQWFNFPEMTFGYKLNLRPDSLKTITINVPVLRNYTYWEEGERAVVWMAAGFVIKTIIK
jgi:hypothetical protein